MENNYFRSIPTNIELNGPILQITQQPDNFGACDNGTATFSAAATATFPTQDPPNPVSNTGTISFKWYEVGVGPLTDGPNVSGSSTSTLTLSNLTNSKDNNRQFYAVVDYVPSAYEGGKTANAINEPLTTNTVVLTVYPSIVITSQPTSTTVSQTRTATFAVTATPLDGTLIYQWQLNGSDLSDGGSVSGARSPILQYTPSSVGTFSIRVRISHPTACNSPVFSNTVTLTVVDARQIINIEYASESGSGGGNLTSINLFNNSYVLAGGDQPGRLTCLYAPEKDVNVIMELYGSKGADGSGYRGGEGGVSIIRFTMRQNDEYIITSLPQSTGSGGVFLYRKSRLIASIGGGGSAGNGGNGGNGGGINVPGQSGSGRGAGAGGSAFSPGSLPSNGIFGSLAGALVGLYPGDSYAPDPLGGRVIPCPKGWWYNLGYGACSDIGNQQLWRANGNVVTNSATIPRGFKSGYGIRNTAGRGINGGGNGGGGALGGNGGNGGGGGGGGSGYTDGSVTVIYTQQGGNSGVAKVIIRSAD